MKLIFIFLITIISISDSVSQGEPWKRPLKICTGSDGLNFTNIQTFQDSAGVPCVIMLPDGNLISAFQWFRQPVGSLTWDRVAVKFSSDSGISWTSPQPVIMNGLPSNFKRPFDPALTVTDSGKIRMFFSSGLNVVFDTSINTYSAISNDGVNYIFEPNIRFGLPDRPVIDPAIIKFNGLWHLINPVTGGGIGAYHNISNNGLDFTRVSDIVSDVSHSWIGNFMIISATELRFYGSGMNIWFSSSSNGGIWSAFINTNINGGDPAPIKLSENNFLMIYTGQPYPVSVTANIESADNYKLSQNYPNPFNPQTIINYKLSKPGKVSLKVFDVLGNEVATIVNEKQNAGSYNVEFDGNELASGVYFYQLLLGNFTETRSMLLLK
ncbi:MAG: T9SS type A sorting domain-containing protein [Ignavibacteria bacterium]|nr:T9SS type A sorting domain-containing protein [Ignavibacteria bacterium]